MLVLNKFQPSPFACSKRAKESESIFAIESDAHRGRRVGGLLVSIRGGVGVSPTDKPCLGSREFIGLLISKFIDIHLVALLS